MLARSRIPDMHFHLVHFQAYRKKCRADINLLLVIELRLLQFIFVNYRKLVA